MIWNISRIVSLIFVSMAICVQSSQSETTNRPSNFEELLKKNPPSCPITSARKDALFSLDDWLTRPESENDMAVIAYYRLAIDRVIEKLKKDRVKSGVRIFQLYSSSVIVQTPDTVFAFDLDIGPSHRSNSTQNGNVNTFQLTNEQIGRLASLIDISFHTHEHDDHIDPVLTKSLLEAGKTVVTTQSNKTLWSDKPWAAKLKALDQTLEKPLEIGSLKVDVLWDRQWGDSLHTRGTACHAFIVTTSDGVSVMTKGDINCGLQLYGWLNLLKQRGREIDVFVGSPIFWRGIDVLPELNNLFSPLWLPGHAWEFGHRRKDQAKGNCAGFLQSWRIVHQSTRSENVQTLSWGEWIDFSPSK